jgi:hypothetical protein
MLRSLRDEYQTAEGIQFEDVLPVLAQAERWIQWAESAATSSRLSYSDQSGNARYNLNQFWTLKRDHYNEDPTAWDLLDLRASRTWAILAELGMIKDNPIGQDRYLQEAQQAYAAGATIADRLGKTSTAEMMRRSAGQSASLFAESKNPALDDSWKTAVSNRVDELEADAAAIMGVPLWAWGLAAAALAYLLLVKR